MRLTIWGVAGVLLAALGWVTTTGTAMAADSGSSAEIHVYASGSLRTPLRAVARQFTARHYGHVVFVFSSAGLLRQRIQHGADADVFASADMGQPKRLAARGGWHAPVAVAYNRLCLLTRGDLHMRANTVLATLLKPDVVIGTSTPKADPSGDYTWQMFHRANTVQPGAFAVLNHKAKQLVGAGQKVPAPAGVNAVAWLLEQHKVDVFVSYCTSADALRRKVPRLNVVQLPPSLAVHGTVGLTWKRHASIAVQHYVRLVRGLVGGQAFLAAGFRTP